MPSHVKRVQSENDHARLDAMTDGAITADAMADRKRATRRPSTLRCEPSSQPKPNRS